MNNFTLNTKIILRNDTRVNWESANPVLTKGEMGIEVDTGKVKIGDGVKTWSELGYANVLPSELDVISAEISTVKAKVDVDKVSTAISSAIAESEAKLGTSATRNVGTAVGNVVEVLADGKIAPSLIPSIAITDTFVVDSEESMLALSKAEKGDIAIRTDVKETYILFKDGYSVLENWKLLQSPSDSQGGAVTSVNGQIGAVTLTTTDIAEGNNLYYTEERVNANFRTQSSTSLLDSDTLLRSTDTIILNGGNA